MFLTPCPLSQMRPCHADQCLLCCPCVGLQSWSKISLSIVFWCFLDQYSLDPSPNAHRAFAFRGLEVSMQWISQLLSLWLAFQLGKNPNGEISCRILWRFIMIHQSVGGFYVKWSLWYWYLYVFMKLPGKWSPEWKKEHVRFVCETSWRAPDLWLRTWVFTFSCQTSNQGIGEVGIPRRPDGTCLSVCPMLGWSS
jgi:hypothetical protein